MRGAVQRVRREAVGSAPARSMTIVLLASVSLVALLVASRPLLLPDADLTAASSAFQTGVQAPFQVNTGKDDSTPFHLVGYSGEDVVPIASFHDSDESPPFETVLDSTVEKDTNDERDNATAPEPDESPSAPFVALAFSCIAAFLALACVALTLYIIKSLRSQMLASTTAWELLPRFWRRPRTEENSTATGKQRLSSGGCLLLQSEHLLVAEEGSAHRNEAHPGDRSVYFDTVSDTESEWDDVDEKYQDALDMTPLVLIHDLPLEDNVSRPSIDLPSLPICHPLDQQTVSDRGMPLMRELCLSPISRPAWSVRAIDSPALGLSSRQGGVDVTPEPIVHPHRRAYRSPVPELDIALAMQLRPGLGIGADSAWMVRFLMAIFGWFAVALTGNTR